MSLIVWQDCVFSFILFSFVYFVDLMNMSSIQEDQIIHDATQVVENSGASPTMIGLRDVLKNIEQILASFKHYIEASEAGMAQVPPMAQASSMEQTLPIAQTTHANVPHAMQRNPSLSCRRSLMGLN
jgi:hypothetical protein